MTLEKTRWVTFFLIRALLILLLFSWGCSDRQAPRNRLQFSSSPYLKSHADNPVDWYEWGEEALSKARKENKPLLISIGYASCHWCHEMEKESFMDSSVASVMNENFVCIKVDREERPDLDNIYINACQLITGNSGWPLHAFALPDGKPFYAGTYFSKPGWLSLLKQISLAYKTQSKKLVLQAQALSNNIAQLEFSVLTDTTTLSFDKSRYQALFEKMYQKMDLSSGGFKGAPKFLTPSVFEFLLQYHYLTKDKRALDIVTTSLTRMALGGIYDQVGGGFARYSTDSLWHIPHFEKMLYDNAQLMSIYAHAYQVTGDDFFKRTLYGITSFVQHELKNGSGYFSSVNADTGDGNEGEYYSWSAAEFNAQVKNTWIADYYQVSVKGNWKPNRNILFATCTPGEYSRKMSINPVDFNSQLISAHQKLSNFRDTREKPSVDGKVLTSWNALLIKGFVDAYTALGDDIFLQHANSLALFLEKRIENNGKLWRTFSQNNQGQQAFLDDYAFLSSAYLQLYQVTFNKRWLEHAKHLMDYSIDNFYDQTTGMFFYTDEKSRNSPMRKVEIADKDMPSSNAVLAEVLYHLSLYFDESDYLNKSKHLLSKMNGQLNNGETNFYGSWCYVTGLFSYGTNEVAIVGEAALEKNKALQKQYLPSSIFMGSTGEENLPLLVGKQSAHKTLIYVCKRGTCKRPVEETETALMELMNYGDKNYNR